MRILAVGQGSPPRGIPASRSIPASRGIPALRTIFLFYETRVLCPRNCAASPQSLNFSDSKYGPENGSERKEMENMKADGVSLSLCFHISVS